MQKITPFLWFNDNAEEAVDFYTSVFKDATKGPVTYYTEGSMMPEGMVMTIAFTLFGQEFVALNGGPHFKFNEAVSFVVNCNNQDEVDYYWNTLSGGGNESMCGWLKDKYGLSWQIIPISLPQLLAQTDPAKSKAVVACLMKMKKIVISELEAAAG